MTDDYDDYYDRIVDPIFGRPIYFDKQGNPISMRQWGQLKFEEHDDGSASHTDYAIIGRDEVDGVLVSTVWMGLDHGFSRTQKPVIFETMVFDNPDDMGDDRYMRRYCTEEEAARGHRSIVDDLRAGMPLGWEFDGLVSDEWSYKHNG